MIRSTWVLAAALTGLAAPAVAQDRRTIEAEAAAAQAAEAAADALRAAQGPAESPGIEPAEIAPLAIEPLPTEPPEAQPMAPVEIRPLHVEPIEVAPLAREPVAEPPALAIEWVAQPVVQPLDEPIAPQEGLARSKLPTDNEDTALAFADAAEDPTPDPDAPQLAYAAPLEEMAPPAPRPARRTTRRVQLAYSAEERAAWLAQCHAVYRGGYDCVGYLARYEQAFGATMPGDRGIPTGTVTP